MRVGLPTETRLGETRVALVPGQVRQLCKDGHEVLVQTGAGVGAFISDDAYAQAGATQVADPGQLREQVDVVLRVNPPTVTEVEQLREGSALIGLLWPLQNLEMVSRLAERRILAYGLDQVPRISRAQSMDARSAMNTVAGYKAVLMAADRIGKFCPLLMTAAGTLRPSQLLVLGAGVAGLVAIGAGRRLGAVVEAFDVRPAVKEQVESLGAKFVDFTVEGSEDQGGYAKALADDQQQRQLALIHRHIVKADMVVCTALIPGRQAPVLVTEEMLRDMAAGSVVVDLAAAEGGNCPLSVPDEEVVVHGVTILGPTNLPALMPVHASQMYSKVISRFLGEATNGEGHIHADLDNDILAGSCITHAGEVIHERTREALTP